VFWRRAGILAMATALAIGILATPGAAKKRHKPKGTLWASTVTLRHATPTQFSGTVGSKLAACRRARLVAIYYTDPTTGWTQPLSVQRADADGRYQVSLVAPAYAGSYQAIIIEQRIRANHAPQRCKQAKSDPLNVQPPPAG
jgi:hypothetical protein